MPKDRAGTSSTPISELLYLLFVTRSKVSLFYFFLFFIFVNAFSFSGVY